RGRQHHRPRHARSRCGRVREADHPRPRRSGREGRPPGRLTVQYRDGRAGARITGRLRMVTPPLAAITIWGMLASRFRVTLSVLLVACSGLVAVVAAPQSPAAQVTGREITAESVASYRPADLMPVDPDVTVGTLPNGLRYYVRENPRPPRRVELRLVVKAGSVLEDPDQLGLAHFVEHMQFEGTTHFPREGINAFLASLGLGIGPDANAATSFDDTQYTLRIPAGSPQALDRALLVLEDWAHAATFDQDAIDRQRAIVLSEWRLNLGAAERTQDKIRRVQLEGSRYADRPPIGDPAVIEKA